MKKTMRPFVSLLTVELLTFGLFVGPVAVHAQSSTAPSITPIKHLVVIFQENISFDHYFGTYPDAANPEGEPSFTALPNTPSVNGLTDVLTSHNPNSLNTTNGTGAVNPFRFDRSQAATDDQDHNYGPEQLAVHGGLMDVFPAVHRASPVRLRGHRRRLLHPTGDHRRHHGLLRRQHRHRSVELRPALSP